jgi:hypothetical protein
MQPQVTVVGRQHNSEALAPHCNTRFNQSNNACLDDITNYLLLPLLPDLTQEMTTCDARGASPNRHISIPGVAEFMMTTDAKDNYSIHVDMTQQKARDLAEAGGGG